MCAIFSPPIQFLALSRDHMPRPLDYGRNIYIRIPHLDCEFVVSGIHLLFQHCPNRNIKCRFPPVIAVQSSIQFVTDRPDKRKAAEPHSKI